MKQTGVERWAWQLRLAHTVRQIEALRAAMGLVVTTPEPGNGETEGE